MEVKGNKEPYPSKSLTATRTASREMVFTLNSRQTVRQEPRTAWTSPQNLEAKESGMVSLLINSYPMPRDATLDDFLHVLKPAAVIA